MYNLAGFSLQWRGVNNFQYHHGGRVWLIWIDQIFDVHIMSMSDQHITARVTELGSSDTFLFTIVYGSNDDNDRLKLWEDLKRVKDNWRGPWCVCGDFNNLLSLHEIIGKPVLWNDIVEFRHCVDYCELMDIKAQGAYFTSNNKHDPTTRVFSRLDRVMINLEWMNTYPGSHAYFLPEALFDHNPSICYRRMERQHRPHFRYFNMWGQDPHFFDIIKHTWQKKVTGSWMFQVVTKQRNLKQPLKQLNRARFADVEKAVEVAKLRLSDLQKESNAAEEYRDLCRAHHSYGLLHTDLHNIEKAFLGYYQDLLGRSTDTLDVHVPTVRKGKLVTEQHMNILLKPVSIQEVKEAIFSIPAIKSPGPDGFTSQFYRDSWDIIGKDFILRSKLCRLQDGTDFNKVMRWSVWALVLMKDKLRIQIEETFDIRKSSQHDLATESDFMVVLFWIVSPFAPQIQCINV
ncbi:uncharacterized protein LOC141601638 [Silene latifolia]|uniref:uncharacterized protein LOC141601638 n=1 Tax=Silene latifolia TaxID=37657 RepID=UPI003D772499